MRLSWEKNWQEEKTDRLISGSDEERCKVKILDTALLLLYHYRAMEDFVRQSLLFDFYGDLLTEHQKLIYGSFIQEDLSLSEIAQDSGISRQGVHDMIRRCRNILEEYESKLHLVDRFLKIREKVSEISESESLEEAKSISEEIMELL